VKFSNIPYAEPPTGENRFLEPIPVQTYKDGINNGSVNNVCPQYQVGWFEYAKEFGPAFALSTGLLPAKWQYPIDPEHNYTYPIDSQPSPAEGNIFVEP